MVLDITFLPGVSKAVVIANAVRQAVVDKILMLGSAVPPYRLVAKCMGLKRSVVGDAWRILAVEYKLFIGCKGGGTSLVNQMPEADSLINVEKVLSENSPLFRFDMETAGIRHPATIKLRYEMNKIENIMPPLNVNQLRQKAVPGLGAQLALMIHENLSIHYSESQIYYIQGLPALIYRICAAISVSKKVFLLTNDASANLVDAVNKSGKVARFIGTDEEGLIPEQLERECKKSAVAFLYLRSRSIYPGIGMSEERRMAILAIQYKYRFIIIEDDCHAGFYLNQPNLLMEMVKGTDAKVLYLCPVSLLEPGLFLTYVMAGPVKLVAAVAEKFLFAAKINSSLLVLRDLLQRQILRKLELKMQKSLAEVNAHTSRLLRESGLWDEKGIAPKLGWYFLLKPLKGRLPPDIREKLLNKRFMVVDSEEYMSELINKHGLLISVAGYLGDTNLTYYLLELNEYLKSIIIMN